MLAATLAFMAAKRDTASRSATFFAAQVDFTHAGDLKVFVDKEQLAALEKRMEEQGYLEGGKMASTFNMLRSNDLLWPYIINNYLKGKRPSAFDLLYWNSDATRMPAANHSFYLRNCYLENNLAHGKMEIGGTPLDLQQGEGAGLQPRDARGPHRAGQIGLSRQQILRRTGAVRALRLRPYRRRGQSARPEEVSVLDRQRSRSATTSTNGWPRPRSIPAHGGRTGCDWLKGHDGAEVPARQPGSGKLKPIEDAPGSYVKVRD